MKTIFTLLVFSFTLHASAAERLPIIQMGHPTLRMEAREIELVELQQEGMQKLIDDMVFTMKKASGVGLAAPQVNHSLRLFVMRSPLRVPLTVVINPTIEYLKEYGTSPSVEGCLSIPGQRLKVERYNRIRMSYFDRQGGYVTEEMKGLKAIISQHEYDHLNGVLIVDLIQQMFTELDFDDYVNAPLM